MLNLLSDISLPIILLDGEVSLNFLGVLIGMLIGAVGITGLGIIIYCLILKVVTLPLDIWQRASTRKQNLKMEAMRGQLEKLKKQYENNPELYQKKMQEVYKENNYNMLSSCLPMIVTLVVFMFAITSLTDYSQHMNLQTYVNMADAYNASLLDGHCLTDLTGLEGEVWYYGEGENDYDENYVSYKNASDDDEIYIYIVKHKTDDTIEDSYKVDTAKLMRFYGLEDETACETYVEDVLKETAREAAADSFESQLNATGISFLWIKNIYCPDVAWTSPLRDYSDFCSDISRDIEKSDGTTVSISDFITEGTYNEITANLTHYQDTPNGYFILIVLTILANVGSQFVSMRSQKAQRELQSADPTSQKTQKYMMFIMPIIFAVFAFMYSAAFSLYLITSSVFTMLSTLIINKVIDSRYQKAAQVVQAKNGKVALTRDWDKNEENKKNSKNKKK